jgi:hypothetical protein
MSGEQNELRALTLSASWPLTVAPISGDFIVGRPGGI